MKIEAKLIYFQKDISDEIIDEVSGVVKNNKDYFNAAEISEKFLKENNIVKEIKKSLVKNQGNLSSNIKLRLLNFHLARHLSNLKSLIEQFPDNAFVDDGYSGTLGPEPYDQVLLIAGGAKRPLVLGQGGAGNRDIVGQWPMRRGAASCPRAHATNEGG